MHRFLKMAGLAVAAFVLAAALNQAQAQVIHVYYPQPAPVVTYYTPSPTVYYAAPAPTTVYYQATPVNIGLGTGTMASYSYYPPTTTVYSPPTRVYAAPVVSTPGTITTRTYVGYGVFRPRGVYSQSYYTPGITIYP